MTSSVIQRLVEGRRESEAFVEAVQRAKQQFERMNVPATLVMFSLYTPEHNHWGQSKDRDVASNLAEFIEARVRSTDTVLTYGATTVAVLLLDTAIRDAVCLAERLRREVEGFHALASSGVPIVGAVQMMRSESAQLWIERAEKMLGHARVMGRSWTSFDPAVETVQEKLLPTRNHVSTSMPFGSLEIVGA